jgi:uncharacterized protein YkwD
MPDGLGRRAVIAGTALLLAAVVSVPASSPGGVAAATIPDPSVIDAENQLVARLNADRAGNGLIALQLDPRLTAIARSRSADMAARNYFSHQQPDGRTIFDIIETSGIDWYGAAETIASNPLPEVVGSAIAAKEQWMESAPHREILLGARTNYLGVGSATDATGRTIWTAVLIEGPDRTPPVVRLISVARTGTTTAGASVRVRWSGADVQLATHTAGLRDFQIQRRVDGRSWLTVRSATTATSLTTTLPLGHRWEFRVRARDRAGNFSRWSAPRGVSS